MSEQRSLPEGFDWRSITPEDSPLTPMDVMSDARHQALATATVVSGGTAYNFSRPVFDFSEGRKVATGRSFDLIDNAQEKPVALIFGSYT